jgi:YgiT-type zinc finger domain-containing protein
MNTACPICAASTTPMLVPIMVRRAGRIVFQLEVPARHCVECGHVDVDEATQEAVIAMLERHSRPGDDIVFPSDD